MEEVNELFGLKKISLRGVKLPRGYYREGYTEKLKKLARKNIKEVNEYLKTIKQKYVWSEA